MADPFRTLFRLAAVAALALAALQADAEERLALVVGNGAYDAVPGLENPPADARLFAAKLEATGFDVTLLLDADLSELNRAVALFGRALRAAGEDATGLFFYAGHGVQSFGTNYLLPVDVQLTDAADLSLVGVQAQAVLRQMASARNRTNIVILDACRDNPFESIPDLNDNGLAEMKAPTGTFLAYSTAPGAVALDGTAGNSPFTAALARRIDAPGEPIEQLFKQVRIEVLEETGGRQVPWDTSSLTQDFTFVAATARSASEIEAEQLWQSIRSSSDPVQILLFLRAHPESAHADEARALLAALMSSELQPQAAQPAVPLAAEPQPAAPAASEQELIETARTSGTIDAYEAYLEAYPEGTYSELATFELSILREKAAAADDQTAAAPAPTPGPEAAEPDLPAEISAPVTFSDPLPGGGEGIEGHSLATLIEGSPRFPPIEGLPDEVWKGKQCSNCHEWTREALCTQAQTYMTAQNARALNKHHPYGGGFKNNLRAWADNDCR